MVAESPPHGDGDELESVMVRRNHNNYPGAGNGGIVPPVAHRFKPGQSGNPAGRKTAGATEKEWINALTARKTPEPQLRRIAADVKEWPAKRVAALWILRQVESGDMADYEEFLKGTKTLDQLRQEGKNTALVKKARIGKDGVSIELHDRSGEAFDRVCDQTDGKPNQAMHVTGELPQAVQIITPLTRSAQLKN